MNGQELLIDAGINFLPQEALIQKQEQQAALSASQNTPSDQPTAQGTPADAQATTASQQPPRKYANKYDSVEALETGYWNSAQEAARIAAENRVLKETLQTVASTRVNPAERIAERKNYVEELREAAIPVEALTHFFEELADKKFENLLGPITRGATARNAMIARHPGFEQVERSLDQFLTSNPDVNDKYNRMMQAGLEDAALEYAYFAHKSAQPAPTADASGQEQAVARATAALSGTTVGSRTVGDDFASRLAVARERFARDGDERALAAVVLAGIHPAVPGQ